MREGAIPRPTFPGFGTLGRLVSGLSGRFKREHHDELRHKSARLG